MLIKKTCILLVFLSHMVYAQVPTGSLVAFWPFDGNASDLSGFGNNGIMTNVSPAADRFGNLNKALYFDGISSKIIVPASTSIDMLNTDFTISFWEKAIGSNVDKDILVKQNAGSWNGYSFTAGNVSDPGYCISSNHIYFYAAAGAGQDACSDNALLSDSTWHCLTGVYIKAINKSYFYVDGVLQSDIGAASGPTNNSANLSIGYCLSFNSRYFHGTLDNIRMYKRGLSAGEVLALCDDHDNNNSTSVYENNISNDIISLYPNPGYGDFTVHVKDDNSETDIEIFDQCGKKVLNIRASDGVISSGLPEGMYVLKVIQSNRVIANHKLVITK